jgi:hypothetical protein
MSIEPPDPRYEFTLDDGVCIDGDFGVWPGNPAPPDDGLMRFWVYTNTWNSRMLFTAKGYELEWTG